MFNLETKEGRIALIKHIDRHSNKIRKQESYQQWEIIQGRMRKYVEAKLTCELDAQAVKEMPVISSINIGNKIINKEASLYKKKPDRNMTELSDEQIEAIEAIYDDGAANRAMKLANKALRLQQQSLIQVIPKKGKLEFRRLKNHQYDVIEDPENPTEAMAYVISSYDPYYVQGEVKDDLEKALDEARNKVFIVWTPEIHFKMNGTGEVMDEILPNPVAPMLPFVPVAAEKEDCYFLKQCDDVTDFSILFNTILSKNQQIADMQGFAQAYMSGPKELQPTSVTVGPTKILRLITDPQTGVETKFGFISPNANLTEIQNNLDRLVNYFLTSRGSDPASVSGHANGKQFNSAMERLLAMIESFEASQDDMDIFRRAEEELFRVIISWHNALRTTETLADKYTSGKISDAANLSIVYSKPQMIKTDAEKDQMWQRRIELGIASRVDAVMDIYSMSKEEAENKIAMIDTEEVSFGEDQGTEAR